MNSLYNLVKAVHQITQNILVALALTNQVNNVLEDTLAVPLTKLSCPSSVCLLAILSIVSVKHKQFQIYPCNHFLVFYGDWLGLGIEYGLKIGEPAVEVVEIAEIIWNFDVESGVESL